MNRSLLKENAKQALKHNFWIAILVLFIGSLLNCNWNGLTGSGAFNSSVSYTNYASNSEVTRTQSLLRRLQNVINFVTDSEFVYDYDEAQPDSNNIKDFYADFLLYFDMTHEEFMDMIAGAIVILMFVIVLVKLILVAIQFLFGSFLYAPAGVGVKNFFMKNRKAEGKLSDLISAFRKGRYMNTVRTMFSVNIRIFGWSLLFYIPGLIKLYQYYFVAYIMAENPDITPQRAREISSTMALGYKWQIFILELSFLGWMLLCGGCMIFLCIVSCGFLAVPSMVLAFPLAAYQHATFAELYAERREYVLMKGLATEQELQGF